MKKISFTFYDLLIGAVRAAVDRGGKVEPTFSVDVLDMQGEVAVQVERLLCAQEKQATTGMSKNSV